MEEKGEIIEVRKWVACNMEVGGKHQEVNEEFMGRKDEKKRS